jgi:hypothetical protein
MAYTNAVVAVLNQLLANEACPVTSQPCPSYHIPFYVADPQQLNVSCTRIWERDKCETIDILTFKTKHNIFGVYYHNTPQIRGRIGKLRLFQTCLHLDLKTERGNINQEDTTITGSQYVASVACRVTDSPQLERPSASTVLYRFGPK